MRTVMLVCRTPADAPPSPFLRQRPNTSVNRLPPASASCRHQAWRPWRPVSKLGKKLQPPPADRAKEALISFCQWAFEEILLLLLLVSFLPLSIVHIIILLLLFFLLFTLIPLSCSSVSSSCCCCCSSSSSTFSCLHAPCVSTFRRARGAHVSDTKCNERAGNVGT